MCGVQIEHRKFVKTIQYIEIPLAIEQDKVYYFKCKHLFGFWEGINDGSRKTVDRTDTEL